MFVTMVTAVSTAPLIAQPAVSLAMGRLEKTVQFVLMDSAEILAKLIVIRHVRHAVAREAMIA